MKKILLILVALFAVAFWEPRTRAIIMNLTAPLRDERAAESTASTLERIEGDLQETAESVGLYPQPDVFEEWLLQTYRRVPKDEWGSDLYYRIWADSFVVGSPGPDQVEGNADDVRLVHVR